MGAASGVRPYDSGYVYIYIYLEIFRVQMIHATCGANMCKIHFWIPQLLFFVPTLAKTSSFFLGVLFDLKVSTGFIQKRRHSNIFIDIAFRDAFHDGLCELQYHHTEVDSTYRRIGLL